MHNTTVVHAAKKAAKQMANNAAHTHPAIKIQAANAARKIGRKSLLKQLSMHCKVVLHPPQGSRPLRSRFLIGSAFA